MRPNKFAIAAVGLLAMASAAIAATPTQIIAARQQGYKDIGRAMKALMDTLRSPTPSTTVARSSAQTILATAPHIKGWFPVGSGPEAGVKTAALPAIWQRKPEFDKDADNLVAAARMLDAAAASGNIAAVRDAAGKLGGSCKACHTDFRKRED